MKETQKNIKNYSVDVKNPQLNKLLKVLTRHLYEYERFGKKIGYFSLLKENDLPSTLRKYRDRAFEEFFSKKAKDSLGYSNRSVKSKRAQIWKYLHNNLECIHFEKENLKSLSQLRKELEIDWKVLIAWVKEYLNHFFDPNTAQMIYKTVWSERDNKLKQVKYNDIKKIVEEMGARLSTTEEQFNKFKARPTQRHILIEYTSKSRKKKRWKVRVNQLIYLNQWIPKSSKCETYMREVMEELFGVPFPETNLRDAHGLPWKKHHGQYRYDGYNERVRIKDKLYKIRFEYDGMQHDKYVKYYYNNKIKFIMRQFKDKRKDHQARVHNTITIKLKEKDGFDYDHRELFKAEIIRQFEEQTGIRLID